MKCVIAISFLLLLATLAGAQERIVSFQSTVVVNMDRSVDVTEVIEVDAQGINIRRGIFRDIITTTINDQGRAKHLNLTVLSVLKNETGEPYDVEKNNNVDRIRIGSADKILDPNHYTYTIRYNLEQQVRFFDSYDEVYWNVTGTDWQFPIDKASVTIVLPAEAIISQHAGYSGIAGATGCACTFNMLSPHSITYTMTSGLATYEGLTVAVGWQKGIIEGPTEEELAQEKFEEERSIYYGEIGMGILAVYLLIAWFFVGRDPEKEAIVPRFDPPDGFSPAACRFVQRMGFDDKAFTASIINMAVKGYAVIENSKDKYVVKKVGASTNMLSDGEKKIANSLFAHQQSITLGGSYSSTITTAVTQLKSQLDTELRKLNFKKNYGWMVPAILIGVATWIIMLYYVLDNESQFFGIVVGTLFLLFTIFNVRRQVRNIQSAAGFRKVVAVVSFLLFIGIFLGGPFYFVVSFDLPIQDFVNTFASHFLIEIGIIVLIFLFFYLIQAPTIFGRKRMDEIEGLVMFMNAAEKDRLNMLNPPERTPQLFERLLPYAIALDVENAWGKQFDAILKRAIENNEYRPTWYGGPLDDYGRFSRMTSHLGSSMSSAISSSSTPPSSSGSSGSSGGGSSGGGGGGGGGGGW